MPTNAPPEPEPRQLTLGEHLDELRVHVIRGLLGVALFTSLTLAFQDTIMAVVTAPHHDVSQAITEARRQELAEKGDASAERAERIAVALEQLAGILRDAAPVQPATPSHSAEEPSEEQAAPAARHRDLAERYVKVRDALDDELLPTIQSPKLGFLSYQEPFMAHLKLALLSGILIGLPYLIWEMWSFVAEGLLPSERRYVKIFAPASIVLLVVGVVFAYFVLIPISIHYLATYANPELFTATITVDGYLNLFFGLSLAMGLVFELPLVLTFLRLIGVVSAAKLRASRRYFLLIAMVLAAFITPPDPWSMVLATGPLVLLYEVGIVAVALVERRME